jgi:hypothetical protein
MGLMMRKVETNAFSVTAVGPATIGRSFPSNKNAKSLRCGSLAKRPEIDAAVAFELRQRRAGRGFRRATVGPVTPHSTAVREPVLRID